MKRNSPKTFPKSFREFFRLPFTNGGFTLIEILVVVLIIGILGAIALPQYQKAVLKSRYSGMMPIAKALAEANEVFYLEHGNYSENPADLLVAGRDKDAGAYPDGTRVLMYDEDGLSYVRVTNENVPNARYLVYQKHSANFPDTTQCEASDDRANELCVALGGQIIEGGNSSGEAEWTAYLLSGNYGSGDSFAGGGTGDEPGENPGTEPEPQTPQCDENNKPADISVPAYNKSATATCVNGQWKYEWTGGAVYDTDYTTHTTVCRANAGEDYKCSGTFSGEFQKCESYSVNGCAGSEFSERAGYCLSFAANGCANSLYSGKSTYCYGYQSKGCVNSIFSGDGAYCRGYGVDGSCANSTFSGEGAYCTSSSAISCTNSTFSGKKSWCWGTTANNCTGSVINGEQSYCTGSTANGCAGAIIQAGGHCRPEAENGCDGALYGTNPGYTGEGANSMGSCSDSSGRCPNGVPIFVSWNDWNEANGSYDYTWKGNCCNPAYMASGECPSGITVCGS